MHRTGKRNGEGRNKKLRDLARLAYAGGAAPEVEPGNEDFYAVVSLAHTQLRVSQGGFYALDYNVIRGIAEDLGMRLDRRFYRKLNTYEEEAMKIINKKKPGSGGGTDTPSGPCDEDQKAECRIMYGKHFEWTCKQCRDIKGEPV